MSNEQQPNPQQVRQAEYNNLRMTTLMETVSAQRNDALNQVANLTADKPEYVPTVVYLNAETSEVYSRPLSEFIQKFELY